MMTLKFWLRVVFHHESLVQKIKLSFVIIVIFWFRHAEDGKKRAINGESWQCDILQEKYVEFGQSEREMGRLRW